MVKNNLGQVAVRHWNSNGFDVAVSPTRVYNFRPANTVSMAWVFEEDVPTLLSMKAQICCGQSKNKFHLANDAEVSVWLKGQLP